MSIKPTLFQGTGKGHLRPSPPALDYSRNDPFLMDRNDIEVDQKRIGSCAVLPFSLAPSLTDASILPLVQTQHQNPQCNTLVSHYQLLESVRNCWKSQS